METLLNSLREAAQLVVACDPELLQILWASLRVSGMALFVVTLVGLPLGAAIALSRFPGRRLVIALLNTGMGLPPVLVGLVVCMFLWRSGPLGFLELLYTPAAMVIAQIIIAFPIVTALSVAAIQRVDPNLLLQTQALGASRWQTFKIAVRECRIGLLAGIMAAFGGIISEVGAVMMVGGNIKGQTRVLTTGIVLETRMGNFEVALALGLVLLMLSFSVNLALTVMQQGRGTR
ncbi:MAG: ABC transporter permease [Planctomycetota bacterium]|nr:ABC transporter permease [Planctomycetota bacterium]